jgi:hypothetical protein
MRLVAKTTDSGIILTPATPADSVSLDKLKADAATRAEQFVRAKRAEWFATGPGKHLADLRAKLDTLEDSAIATAGRIRDGEEALRVALASGDTATASALETKIRNAKVALDEIRNEARSLRVTVDKTDIGLRTALRDHIAQTRAEFKAEQEAKLADALAAVAETIDAEEIVAALDAAEALKGDAKLDRLVRLPAREGMPGRQIQFSRLLAGTRNQDIPPAADMRPFRPDEVDSDRGDLGPVLVDARGNHVITSR